MKPSELIDQAWVWKAVWTVLVIAGTALGWTGITAWNANNKLNELRAESRRDAASDAAKELTGYVRTTEFLAWQLAFEKEQRSRDKEMLTDLRDLQRRLK